MSARVTRSITRIWARRSPSARAPTSSISSRNPDNPKAHEETTGAGDLGADVAAARCRRASASARAARSRGLAAFFKKHAPHVELVLADPQGSILAEYIATGKMTQKGSWLVEGIGEDFIPDDLRLLADASAPTAFPTRESFSAARELLQKEGDSRRLVHRHAARRGAALLPRAEDAEARRHLRLRHRRALSVEAVQRFLDGGSGLHRAREASATCAT